MFRTVIFLVFIIFKAAASDSANENPVIRLNYSNDVEQNYTVWKDKPLKFVIENGLPTYLRCHSIVNNYRILNNNFMPTIAFNNDGIAEFFVNVTSEMSTRWVCTVLHKYWGPDFTAKNLYFNVHVRGAKAVILKANSRSLTYVTTNLSVNYDGEASYTYVEGEELDISCRKAQGNSNLRLEYYNAAGILMVRTQSRQHVGHVFQAALKSKNDKFYLDCICGTEHPLREYRYRTTFYLKKQDAQDSVPHALILYVNGQELKTILHKDPSYDDYIFRYDVRITGTLNVTCQKRDNSKRGSLSLFSIKYPGVVSKQTTLVKSEAVISANISTRRINNISLICDINNNDVLKPYARILFLYNFRQYGVHIRGLPRNNILYQYTNAEEQRTIEYQYSVNETLNLTFIVFRRTDATWSQCEFEGKYYDNPAGNWPSDPSIESSQETFTKILDTAHNGTKLQCTYFPEGKRRSYLNTSTEVIFRLKPVSEEFTIYSEANEIVSGESSTNNDTLQFSLSSVAAVLPSDH